MSCYCDHILAQRRSLGGFVARGPTTAAEWLQTHLWALYLLETQRLGNRSPFQLYWFHVGERCSLGFESKCGGNGMVVRLTTGSGRYDALSAVYRAWLDMDNPVQAESDSATSETFYEVELLLEYYKVSEYQAASTSCKQDLPDTRVTCYGSSFPANH